VNSGEILLARVSPPSLSSYSEKSISYSDWNGLNWTFIDQKYNGTQDFDNYIETQTWGIGQRAHMVDNSGDTTWYYDRRGRQTSETKSVTGSGTFLTQWGYNSADLVTSMKYPGGNALQVGEVVSYTYNAQMSLNSLYSPTNSYYYVQKTAYDASGRVDYRYLGALTRAITLCW
jgi:hypothetical protein